MKKIILIVIVYAFIGCTRNMQLEKLYVINFYGTELKSEPDFNANTLQMAKLGDSIQVIQDTKIETQKSVIKDDLFLKGSWLKVKTNKHTGYVFSGDNSKIKPILTKNPDLDNGYFGSLLGKKVKKTDSLQKASYGGKTYSIVHEKTVYQNGIYKYYAFDGCFNHEYVFTTFSFNEAYHFLVNEFIVIGSIYDIKSKQIITDFECPTLIKKERNTYYFSDIGASAGIRIEVKDNGLIIVSSYDCT